MVTKKQSIDLQQQWMWIYIDHELNARLRREITAIPRVQTAREDGC